MLHRPLWRAAVILAALFLFVIPTAAQNEETYTDPEGRFTVPIPTNWTAETQTGGGQTYVKLTDPEGKLPVYILVTEAESVEAGLQAAWSVVDPEFALEVAQAQTLPAPEGVDEFAQIVYDTGDPNDIAVGVGQRVGDQVYALIGRGDATTFAQRNAQVVIILTGLDILAVEETSLAGVQPVELTGDLLAELDAFIERALVEFEIPGAAVAIVQDGQIVHLKGYGVKELGGGDPVTPETVMMIGSTGKTMTTLMMATMVDDGLFDWETPVTDILPTFAVKDPARTEQIQMKHLVCACTGVPRRDYELLFNASELSAEDIIESLQTFEFFTDFGEAFQYSNQMVGSGGYIAALAAGGEYGDLFDAYTAEMDARVFAPIGMTSTTFDFDTVQASGNYATPHAVNLDAEYYAIPLSMEQTLTPITPAGASWSNARDMAQYLLTQLSGGVAPDGTRVVSEENLGVTREPQVSISADTSYGLGWMVSDYKGVQLIEHGGNTLGFTSEFAFMPEVGLGISVLTNAQASNLFNQAVRERLLELAFEQEARVEDDLAQLIEQGEALFAEIRANLSPEIDAQAVEPFLGTYTSEALGEVTLSLVEGELIADAGEWAVPLWTQTGDAAEPNTFITAGAPLPGLPVRLREQDGENVMVVGELVTEYTFTKVSE